MGLLAELIEAINTSATEPGPARVAEIRARLAEVPDLNLDDLENDAISQFEEIHKAEDFSAEKVAAMTVLAEICDAAREQRTTVAAEAEATTAQINELASRVNIAQPGEDGDTGEGTELPPATPALEGELVSAGQRVPLRSMPKNLPTKIGRGNSPWTIEAAAELRGVNAGAELPGTLELAQHAGVRLNAMASGSGVATTGLASVKFNRDPRLIADGGEEAALNAMNYAVSESRLPGGSLVAAGGWCAPSEIMYDFCDGASADGLLTLPTITARRGGVRWPTTPDFASLYTGTGFCMTEAEVIAQSTDKPCYEIPCPSFNECRLGICGVCVKVPTLTERGYPELVRYVIDQVLIAHQHRLNAKYLASMEAQSTAVTITADTTVPPDHTKEAFGPGAVPTLLATVELQVEYLRYKRRLSMDATMELVAPAWVRGILRSDLAKRQSWEGPDGLNVSNATLDSYLRTRGVNPQWVMDWQDAYANGNTTDFGGATAPKVWPGTAKFMIYPAGTFVLATNDVIEVNGLYDSALLARNMHLALFSESGWCVIKKCYESILLNIPLCPNGAVGPRIGITCPAA